MQDQKSLYDELQEENVVDSYREIEANKQTVDDLKKTVALKDKKITKLESELAEITKKAVNDKKEVGADPSNEAQQVPVLANEQHLGVRSNQIWLYKIIYNTGGAATSDKKLSNEKDIAKLDSGNKAAESLWIIRRINAFLQRNDIGEAIKLFNTSALNLEIAEQMDNYSENYNEVIKAYLFLIHKLWKKQFLNSEQVIQLLMNKFNQSLVGLTH